MDVGYILYIVLYIQIYIITKRVMLTRVIRFFCNIRNPSNRHNVKSKHIHELVKISKTEQQELLLVRHYRQVNTGMTTP